MSAITCDSCVMQRFAKYLVSGVDPQIEALVFGIATNHAFAMDAEGKMQHQWLETCGHQVFGEYLFQWLREGKISLFPVKLHEQHRKHLRTKCGFPFTERHEGVFVAVAAGAFPHILVAEDIDFWEPKEKGCAAARRAEVMRPNKGAVCRYVSKHLQVQVVTVDQAIPMI